MDEGFCRPARQKSQEYLSVLQEFFTRQGGKRPDLAAFTVLCVQEN